MRKETIGTMDGEKEKRGRPRKVKITGEESAVFAIINVSFASCLVQGRDD